MFDFLRAEQAFLESMLTMSLGELERASYEARLEDVIKEMDELFRELWLRVGEDLTSGASWDSDELDRRWELEAEIARRTGGRDAEV